MSGKTGALALLPLFTNGCTSTLKETLGLNNTMSKEKKSEELQDPDHTIPGPVAPEVLRHTVLGRVPHEEESIHDYVAWQAPDEQIIHLEKVTSERVFGRKLDVWDVHTDKNRWWVITNPTNLYSQELFPSLDYTLSFHVGVTARMMADESKTASHEQWERLSAAWRRWEQAAEALDKADEAEEFQAVGMRCRECLLAFIRAVADKSMVPVSHEAPKSADFIQWSEVIAHTIAQGSRTRDIRQYLKSLATSTWQLVNWLTHATNAVEFDGRMAVDATQNTLVAFNTALVRYERGVPDRCPQCSSYKLTSVYQPGLDVDPPYITLCESCGWATQKDEEHDSKF